VKGGNTLASGRIQSPSSRLAAFQNLGSILDFVRVVDIDPLYEDNGRVLQFARLIVITTYSESQASFQTFSDFSL
jgi:hypothetical protein